MKKLSNRIKPSVIIILTMTFVLGLLLGRLVKSALSSENSRFEDFTDELFISQVSGNTLNLHYTLADPAKYGIKDYALSLGSIDASKMKEQYSSLENCQAALDSFAYEKLDDENQMTWDVLDLYFDTELSLGDNYLLQEVLSPSLGIQAQLPILLAEYTFRSEKDIQDYLGLLQAMDTYFSQIIAFEQEKSANGLFMSDATADGIMEQCNSFISNPDNNYLTSIFEEKIQAFPGLSKAKKSAYIKENQQLMKKDVIPAYQKLVSGLQQLKGTGKNPNGLAYYKGGKEYYNYLLQSNCGLYDSVETIQTRLYRQMIADYGEIKKILTKDPTLATSALDKNLSKATPDEMLADLRQKMSDDFPAAENASYDIKYVHQDLEKYLSPAFYLTPPLDTLSPNSIYINKNSNMNGIELYTTLAHEGFPGHLYQTLYFASESPAPIRNLLNMGGYIEGWATYIESYAYGYADIDEQASRLLWLNRSMNLCLYSLLDIGIHYHGWTIDNATSFLKNFGITDTALIQSIFQSVVEDPGNYLKYYMGYLSFVDIREEVKANEQDDFKLKEFHQEVLEIGPAQFPILEKHLLEAS